MAGPTCSVLLPSRLGETQRVELRRVAGEFGWEFGRSEQSPLFLYEAAVDDPSDRYDATELLRLETILGWKPLAQVVCVAMYSRSGHQHLGDIALALAERFDGVVDLGGTLEEALSIDDGHRWTYAYEVDRHRHRQSWVVNAAWLRAWRAHPGFRMVK